MADTPTPRPLTADGWHPHGTRDDTLVLYYSIEDGPLAEIVCYGDVTRDEVLASIRDADVLRAEVGRLTADLATTTNLLHNLFDRYDLGADGEPAERYEARAAQPQEPT